MEAETAGRFHVPTAVALSLSAADQPHVHRPPPTDIPSLVVHADQSELVPPKRIRELDALGFAVRGVRGAGHSVWYGYFEEFMRELYDRPDTVR